METPATERDPEEERLPSGGLAVPRVPGLSLERVPLTLIDRWLPARPAAFLTTVLVASAACWIAGYLLAADKQRFLASRDWQSQPLYLATHFVILRMFVTAYARNFLAGSRNLTIPAPEAQRRIRNTLAPWGWLCAAALAAPFVYYDLVYLMGSEFAATESTGSGGIPGWADYLLAAIWTLEWIINAYVWVVILGFLVLTMRVLKSYRFRQDLEIVLGERHYKPFLLMSAQGASVVLVFSIASALYVWHAQGETTDYLGLWITAALLIFCFVPPWLRLKNGILRLARTEADRLNREIEQGFSAVPTVESPHADNQSIASRLNLLLTMARAGHLERLYRDFGRNEGQAMLLRLLAPLATVVWKLFRPG